MTMKRYYVDSVIEGEPQTNEVNKRAYEQLKGMGDTFPLKVYKEAQMDVLNEDGDTVASKPQDSFEIIEVPFKLRVEGK